MPPFKSAEVEWVIQQSITLVSVCAHWLIHQSTAVSGAQLFYCASDVTK